MTNKIKVEIWSDVMCPFCYIGKRNFEAALAQFPYRESVEVEWKSFQLQPDLVTDPSKNSIQHLAESKGWTLDYARQMTDHVVSMAHASGLTYHMEKAIVANSFKAHQLLQYAKSFGRGNEMEEALFRAYFTDGENTADDSVLTRLAVEAGLDALAVEKVSLNDEYAAKVYRDIEEAAFLKIRGVPFFVFNRKLAVSGAQPSDLFLEVLEKAYEDLHGQTA